jgi:hypothetical protein
MNAKSALIGLGKEVARAAGMLLMLAFVQTSAWADLRFAEPVIEAGEVRAGAPLSHAFRFRNEGDAEVVITGLRGSCGCLAPHADKEHIKPGGEGSVLLDIHTLGQAQGPHRWRVTVSYRSGNSIYEMPLLFSARVVREISVQPASVTVFADHAASQEILITDMRSKPLRITKLSSSSRHLGGAMTGEYQDGNGKQVLRIRLQVPEDFPEGRHAETLTIATDDPDYPELRVPISIIKHARERIGATPNQVALEVLDGQAAAGQLIMVRDRENHKVVVEEVICDDPAVKCRWSTGPGAMATVKVMVDRSQAVEGNHECTVQVRVNQPVRETVMVPVTFTIR